MGLAHLSINFLGFLEIFRLCLYHWRLFLKYLVLFFFGALFLEETLRERTPSQERIPSQAGGRTSTGDQLGPSPSSGAGSCASSTPAGWSMSGLWLFSSRSVSVHYSLRLRLARLFQSDSEQYGSDYQSVFTRLYFLGLVFTYLSVSDLSGNSVVEEVF